MADDWKGWEEQKMEDTPVYDFTKNRILKGLFIEKREQIGHNGSNMYIFENADNNERVAIWGNTLLDTRLKNCVEGQEVGLEYLGLAKSEKTGWEYHNFKVFKRPMEEIS